MKPETVYREVSVNERLPDDREWHFILNADGGNIEVGYVKDGKLQSWDDELTPSHWLEKREDVYVLTETQLREVHEKGYWDFNVDGKNCVQSFEEWKQINLK